MGKEGIELISRSKIAEKMQYPEHQYNLDSCESVLPSLDEEGN